MAHKMFGPEFRQDMDIDELSDSERYSWLPTKDNLKTDHVEVKQSPL